MTAPAKKSKKSPRLRPDLPGGRKRKGESVDENKDPKGAMRGGDDRRHAPREGNRGRKRRGFGDQGGWV